MFDLQSPHPYITKYLENSGRCALNYCCATIISRAIHTDDDFGRGPHQQAKGQNMISEISHGRFLQNACVEVREGGWTELMHEEWTPWRTRTQTRLWYSVLSHEEADTRISHVLPARAEFPFLAVSNRVSSHHVRLSYSNADHRTIDPDEDGPRKAPPLYNSNVHRLHQSQRI